MESKNFKTKLKFYYELFKQENGFSNLLIGLMAFIVVCFCMTCLKKFDFVPWAIWQGIGLGATACFVIPIVVNFIQYYRKGEEFRLAEIPYTMLGIIPGVPAGLAVMYYKPSLVVTGLILLPIFILWIYVWNQFAWFKKSK